MPQFAPDLGVAAATEVFKVAEQPARHPPWPHRHATPEGAIVKAVLVLAVLIGAGVIAAVNAWRRWRPKRQVAAGPARPGPPPARRKVRRRK